MVDEFQVNQFKLADGPLAVVIASINFNDIHNPDPSQLTAIRECLAGAGYVNENRQAQRNVTFTGTSNPRMEDFTVYQYLNADRTRGASLSRQSLSYFASSHNGIDELTTEFNQIISCFQETLKCRVVNNLGLRYVNVFKLESIPSVKISPSLTGLGHRGLTEPNGHFHHNYEFWCDTGNGRLHTRYAVTHGDRRPEQLGTANSVFPADKLASYSDHFCHLDIFENTHKLERELELAERTQILRDLNRRIEQAFLNSVTDEAMNQWGATKVE